MQRIRTLLSSAAELIGIQRGCVSARRPVCVCVCVFKALGVSVISPTHVIDCSLFRLFYLRVSVRACVLITPLLCFSTVQME